MAPQFNTYQHSKARLVSSWLHEIPSDAGGGSEATLIAPSVYEQSSPRRRKDLDQPQAAKPAPPGRSPIPNFNATATQDKDTSTPNPTSPARLPIRPRQNAPPRSPSPTKPTNNPPRPGPPTKPAPGLSLRETIIQNFASHCLLCHPILPNTTTHSPSPPETNPNNPNPLPSNIPDNQKNCPRCKTMTLYTNRTHHAPSFLSSHLLPISEVLSFDECIAYLNQAVAARLAGVLARGGRGDRTRGVGRTWPTLDDFDFVRGVAKERKGVLEEFEGFRGGLWLDRFGILRDRE